MPLGCLLGSLGASWWPLGGLLGASWGCLGSSWESLGALGKPRRSYFCDCGVLLGPLGLLSKPLGAGALGLSQNAVGSLLEASWENFAGVFQVSEIKNSSHLICQLPSLQDERGAMRGAFE